MTVGTAARFISMARAPDEAAATRIAPVRTDMIGDVEKSPWCPFRSRRPGRTTDNRSRDRKPWRRVRGKPSDDMHPVHLVPCGVDDAPLATFAALDAPLDTRKRAHELVDAELVCSETLHFRANIPRHWDARVSLHRVSDWQTRMQPGVLVHPRHGALLDVCVGTDALVTIPLLSSAWLLAALSLSILHVDAHLAWQDKDVHLRIDVLTTSACFRPHPPGIADQLRVVVEHANKLDLPSVDEVGGATLVYESLCRREMFPETRLPPCEQPRALFAQLLPFQRRSVSFLLEREAPASERQSLRSECGPWWIRVHSSLFFHVLTGAMTTDAASAAADPVRGAILAEEMGLGKTIEVLALILEHTSPHRHELPAYWDAANQAHVQPVGTTLIVSPETLRRQWLDELAMYAPSLRVYSYTGHKTAAENATSSWGDWASRWDVMVVSFETLARDLAASHAAPVRMLRQPSKYERPRSPLVQLEFWRVVMDEVQLVGGNAARTMGMIRRQCSLAVSGTPVRRLADLRTSLWFLGLVPAGPPRMWKRILSAAWAPYVCRVLYDVGIRHTKAQVAPEMVLPVQKRYLVPVDFTHVETAFYRDVWNASLAALRLDADGAPQYDTWELDTSVLRAQLQRLRQACTHPNVALRGGHMLGSDAGMSVSINLRSIEQVLAQMIEATKQDLGAHKHMLVLSRIYRASVLLFAPPGELEATPSGALQPDQKALADAIQQRGRRNVARDLLETLVPNVEAHIEALEEEVRVAQSQGPLYAFSAEELKSLARYSDDLPADAPHEKLRLRQQYTSALRSRQRHWLQIMHRIQQFSGHCFFQLGEYIKQEEGREDIKPYAAMEETAYQGAEQTRQRLLADARGHVEHCVEALEQHRIDAKHLFSLSVPAAHGLAGRSVLDEIDAILEKLRLHAHIVLDWRGQILARLGKPVNREVSKVREDDDVYAENLDAQIEAETLMEMYRPLLAQRDELLTGRIALGATARPQLFVELDRELRAARLRRFQQEEDKEDEDDLRRVKRLQLQHFRSLEEARRQVMLPQDAEPLGVLLSSLKEARDTATHRDAQLLTSICAALQNVMRDQLAMLEALRKEQMQFQTLFNARALYFKQVQELSDQVQDPEMPQGAWSSLFASLAQERAARQKMGATEGRLRYLHHVKHMHKESMSDTASEARHCYICTNIIETGILTNACGHLCCEACFQAWMGHGHRTCPMCKTRLTPRDVHRVVYRTRTLSMAPTANRPTESTSFRQLAPDTRHAIEAVGIEGGNGSKLDLLIRHLVYLERTTGEKSLVFSSFARGLDLVAESLTHHGLAYVRLEGTGGKRASAAIEAFQHSPDVRVLLLHSEAQSAGLNLLAATHLFLLEPLLNHALELQAIGRVHRIGQTRPTHVYGYMVHDTVEERIMALAAERSQSLYLDAPAEEQDSALVQAAHHVAAQDATRDMRRGDLVGSTNDLLACLFAQHIGSTPGP